MDRPGAARDRLGRADLPGDGRARGDRRARRTRSSCRRARATSASRASRFEYLDGRPVLEDVDLDVAAGRTIALIGHTGSGKTTLTSLVPRFYDVTAGRVTVDGADVRDVTLAVAAARDRRDLAGPVPLLGDGAGEHRVRRARASDDARSSAIARLAQAHEFIERLPGGLRHGDRRARDHALRRPAPAARDRAGARRRPADPDPRRRDRVRRRDDRGADPRSACARRCAGGRRSSSPTASRRSRSPTRSSSSTTAASPRAGRTRSCSRRARSTARSTSTGCSSASSRTPSRHAPGTRRWRLRR